MAHGTDHGVADGGALESLTDAALALAPETGWRGLSLRRVCDEAETPLQDLPAGVRSSFDLLLAYVDRVDRAVLAAAADLRPDEAAKDRLFEVMMARFDAMSDHRAAMARAHRDYARDPAGVMLVARTARSVRRGLEAAGFATGGARGALFAQGATAAFLRTLPIWFEDEPGLSKTMAALDARLRNFFKPPRARLFGLDAREV